ncbi:hypothetical protein ACFLQ1_02270 [Candidatus Auribacterota bacterium]
MKKIIPIAILLISVLLSYSVYAGGNDFKSIYRQLGIPDEISYSADIEDGGMGASMGISYKKIYYKNGNLRTEGEQMGKPFISIMRAEGEIYNFDANTNSWNSMNRNSVNQSLPPYQAAGKETIDGKSCLKYTSEIPQAQMTNTVWVHKGVICKVASSGPYGSSSLKYINVKKGKLADSLFMPPADAKIKKMNSMMDQWKK